MEYFLFSCAIESRRAFFQNLICIELGLLCPNTVWLYHERVMMKVVALRSSAIFIGPRILVTDLFHDLTWTKIISHFIESPSVWIISSFNFRYFPCRLPVLKKPLSYPSDKSLLIYPTLFFPLQLLEPVFWQLMAPGWHPYLFELHVLLDSFHLRSDSLSIFNVLFLLFVLNSWSLSYLSDLIVLEFRVLVYYIVLFIYFLSI